MDQFRSMEELLAAVPSRDNYSFHIETKYQSKIKLFAPHGGCIEPCTSHIVMSLATGTYDSYIFNGIRKKECFKNLHVTSTNYDEPHCLMMARDSEMAISVHGCNDSDDHIQIGGGNKAAAAKLADCLTTNGYVVVTPSDDLQGANPKNFINLSRRKGIQLELSVGFRKNLFPSFPKSIQKDPKQFDRFIKTMRNWLDEMDRQIQD